MTTTSNSTLQYMIPSFSFHSNIAIEQGVFHGKYSVMISIY